MRSAKWVVLPIIGALLGVSGASACSSSSVQGETVRDTEAAGDEGDSDGDTDGGEPAGPGWYAGDLHLHSSWSEDALDNPVDEVIALAEERGLDFFVFTDHDNHVEGDIQTWSDPLYASDRMVMLYGTEYTTARGHANIFGDAPWDHLRLWDLREDQGTGRVITDEAHALGLHFSVNHPVNADPWEFSLDLDYDSMEIWNAVWNIPANNDEAVQLWDELLVAGRRIPGRGGSDCHHQDTFEANILNVGNPTTWIYAEAGTPDAIIDGLEAGHASISYAPDAERIELRADADGDGEFEALMGDDVDAAAGVVAIEVRIDGFRDGAPYTLVLVQDGVEVSNASLESATFTTTIAVPDDAPRTYVRAELRGEVPLAPEASATLYADVVALSNPIYVNYE